MKQSINIVLLLVTLTAGIVFILLQQNPLPAATPTASLLSGTADWQPQIHNSSNAYHMWRNDPLLQHITAFCATFSGVAADQLFFTISLITAFIGLSLMFFELSAAQRLLESCLSSAFFLLVCLLLWGNDLPIMAVITWLPWLVWILLRLRRNSGYNLPNLVLLLFFAVRAARAANQLSLLVSVSALLLAAACRSVDSDNFRLNFIRRRLIFLLVLLPALYVQFSAPLPPIPDYPQLSHVVADDGLPGMIKPLIGPDAPPIPFIDRQFIRIFYHKLSLLICLFLILFRIRMPLADKHSRLYIFSAVAAALLLLDTFTPEWLAHIMPLATLRRVIPGFFLFAITPTVSLIALLSILVLSFAEKKTAWAVCLAILLFLFPLSSRVASFPEIRSAKLQKIKANEVWREFRQAVKSQSLPIEDQHRYLRLLVSPSYSLLQDWGLWILKEEKRISNSRFSGIKYFPAVINDYNKSPAKDFTALKDGRWKTRWTSGSGRQTGDEWLHFYFQEPLPLLALEIAPGKDFQSDYPRGLEIRYKDECTRGEIDNILQQPDQANAYRLFKRIPEWQGAVTISKKGFPYYGAQSRVVIHFPSAAVVQCLLVKQIGRTDNFDWSIAEVKLLVENS